ncbi:hypothetical protein PF005_g7210 [Phytophthora fragariae]|uniref:Uncharacterized protein n=1 Tax=Phytophthora fragariae TaxID=53985 RepID=A0A6A3YM12_9STRA|nr:hypothetical protein PF005_g7210 [Phytophthora fragariae]
MASWQFLQPWALALNRVLVHLEQLSDESAKTLVEIECFPENFDYTAFGFPKTVIQESYVLLLAIPADAATRGDRQHLQRVREAIDLFQVLALVNSAAFADLIFDFYDGVSGPNCVIRLEWRLFLIGSIAPDDPAATKPTVTWGELLGFPGNPWDISSDFCDAMRRVKDMARPTSGEESRVMAFANLILGPLRAAAHGDVSLVKLALERGEVVDIKDENGWTPLLFAAREGFEGVVRLLLYYDATPDLPGKTGSTPLMWAAFTGHEGVVQILLERKAKVNAQNVVGATALGLAAQSGHASVVQLLLNCGATVDLADSDGWTPLMQAARISHTDVVRLLLNNKAQVNAVNDQGKTALHMAAAEGNNGIVRLIQEFVQQCETPLEFTSSMI